MAMKIARRTTRNRLNIVLSRIRDEVKHPQGSSPCDVAVPGQLAEFAFDSKCNHLHPGPNSLPPVSPSTTAAIG